MMTAEKGQIILDQLLRACDESPEEAAQTLVDLLASLIASLLPTTHERLIAADTSYHMLREILIHFDDPEWVGPADTEESPNAN
jgi:hypothetical protein